MDTRWNSVLVMMTRILQLYPSVHKVLWDCKALHLEISSHETSVMEDMVDLLKPFEQATIKLSSESNSTSGMLLPAFAQIRRRLLVKECDKPIIKKVKQVMLDDLDQRYTSPKEQSLLLIASAMDPRFKSLGWINDEDRSKVWTEVEEKVLFYNSQSTMPLGTTINIKSEPIDTGYPAVPSGSKSSKIPPDFPPLPSLSLGEEPPSLESDDFFDDIIIVSEEEGPSDLPSKIKLEVKMYKSVPACPLNESAVSWWQDRIGTYPLLGQLAMRYLMIPATSVPSERVFSAAGSIVNKKRCSLKSENVNMMVFLHANCKAK